MADTRKRYPIGQMIAGFKPGQAPGMIGPQIMIAGLNCFITVDAFDNLGKFDKVVKSFYISFKNLSPQPVGKWLYNPMLDRYVFNGWSHYSQLVMPNRIDFFLKLNAMVNTHKSVFGSAGFSEAR